MHVRGITPGDALREAALILKTYGWVQGRDSDEDGYCLVGALIQAQSVHNDLFPEAKLEVSDAYNGAFDRVYAAIEGSSYNGSIPSWNDAPDRTKDEVVELLERVARG